MCFILITFDKENFRFTKERQSPSTWIGEFSVIKRKTRTVDKLTVEI
jgi:hypothetical protein